MSVRVSAPCRLHFGLFHVPVPGLTHWPDGRPVRKFGGVGLMVETPRVAVEAHAADFLDVTGSLKERAAGSVLRIHSRQLAVGSGGPRPAVYAIRADGPREHVGLGVGTALGMALAAAMTADSDGFWHHSQFVSLANLCGRGQRSAIGVWGFGYGGLIVDGGKVDESVSPLGTILAFPSAWRAVLIRPPVDPAWHGDTERAAFGRSRSAEQALDTTERLERIARDWLVPAVQDEDFDAFAEAVHEFNRLAGEPFAADQGGAYSYMAVNCVIDELLGWGVTGVGQSSWGPTVFAFARDPDEAEHLAGRVRAWLPSDAEVTVTAADNQGARIEIL